MTILSILPASGFGQLRFGSTLALVFEHLDEPSCIIEAADEPGRRIWVFDDMQLAAGFNASGLLDTFEVWNAAATLHGRPIIGVPVQAGLHADDVLRTPLQSL